MSQTLHAVLVGITEYPIASLRLPSCTDDVKDVNKYLKEYCASSGVQYKSHLLLDEKATREGIINGFDKFKKAKDGDICVFYFSGHGSQANAPKEFWTETDRMLESIVCYDSRMENGFDLIDKELGALIWTATQDKNLHFVAILDSCHSGDITKDISSHVLVKNAPANFEMTKSLGEFHGYNLPKDKNPYIIDEKGIAVKNSNHIVLSASKNYETAKVVYMNGRYSSVFTLYLLETLKQNGPEVSYNDLLSRVRIKTENTVSKQTPQVEGRGKRKKTESFLNGVLKGDGFPYLLAYDKRSKKWKLNAGGVQGIILGSSDLPTKVELNTGASLHIKKVNTNSSYVEQDKTLDTSKIYTARIQQMQNPELKIHVSKDMDLKLRKKILSALREFDFLRYQVKIANQEKDARYIIRANDKIGLSFHKQGGIETIFEAVELGENLEISLNYFLGNINHVLNWKFVLDLQNERSKLPENCIEIDLNIIEGGEVKKTLSLSEALAGDASLRYAGDEDEKEQPHFNLSIKNISNKDLTLSLLFLSYEYSITNALLPVKDLDKKKSGADFITHQVEYDGELNIPLIIADDDLEKGIREVVDYLKIIVTTRGELDTDAYNQETIKIKSKSLGSSASKYDWRTYNIPLTVTYPSPQKNLIPTENKNLDLGMCTVSSHNALQGKIQLKSAGDIKEKSVNNGAMLEWNSIETQGGILSKSASGSSSTDILEITDIVDRNAVSDENPLVLDFKGQVNENEGIYPFGYDSETGLWYPIGNSNGSKTIINKLPTSDKGGFYPIWEKGILFDSVKIYLKKITGIVEYPLFQHVNIGKDKDSMKFKVIDNEINNVKKAKNVILFVHGIMGNNYDKPQLIHLARELIGGFEWNEKEDVVLAFDYESLNTSIEQTSEDLLSRLEENNFPEKTDKTNYIIIAHSMGGLVSRFLLEHKGGNKYFNHFIQVGTPNYGSPLATVFKGMEYTVTFALNYFLPKQFTFPLSFLMKAWDQINNTAHELASGSKTVKKLNDKSKDPDMPYHIVLGDMSFGGDESSYRAMKGVEEAIAQQNRVKKLLTKVQKTGLDTLLGKEGAHDGIVPVESMRKVLQVAAKDNWKIQPKAHSTYCHHFKYFNTEPGVVTIGGILKEKISN